MNDKIPFAQKHPHLNVLMGLFMLILIFGIGIAGLYICIKTLGAGLTWGVSYLQSIVQNTDKVVVVALITGGLSVLSILISSTIGKIYEYRYNVKKYQYEKKETAYVEFINIYYDVLDKSRKNLPVDGEDMILALNEFSKKLTLWGSNEVIKKWLKFRMRSITTDENPQDILFIMEDIMFSIRKDLGNKRGMYNKLKKGDLLAFVINDIHMLKKK